MIVIGAGICGLAAAYELARRGEEVVVLERGEAGGEQSAGLGRIFRTAHGQARLCALALEAREGWRRWEDELGVRLLGQEQMVVAALLAAGDGSYASHRAAARLWGLLDEDTIDITTARHPRIHGVPGDRRVSLAPASGHGVRTRGDR